MDLVSAFLGQNNRSGLGIGVLRKKVNGESGIEMRDDIIGRQFFCSFHVSECYTR